MEMLGPFIFYIAVVLALAATVLLITWLLGGRHRGGARNEVFESGIVPTGGARNRFPIQFYRIAIFFLIFDLEVAFILLWAYRYKQAGWAGLAHVTIFIVLLLAGLIYPWQKGGLEIINKKVRR